MTPNEKGAFCSKCCKTVIDFTEKSPDEITSILTANNSKKICGRFTNDQLEEPVMPLTDLSPGSEISEPSRLHSFAVALFLIFGTTLFSCKTYPDNYAKGDMYIDTTLSGTTVTLPVETVEPVDERMMLGEISTVPVVCAPDSVQNSKPKVMGKIKVVKGDK